MIQLRFVTGSDITSRAIADWQRDGWATHVEAVLSDGSLLGAHLEGGVAIRPKGYDAATMTRELYVDLVASPAVTEAFYDFMHAQVGKPYDVTAIAGLIAGRNWREDDSWICSELVTAGAEISDFIPKLSSSVNHVTPRDDLLIFSALVFIPDAA